MNVLEVNPQLNLAASVFENETWLPCDINSIHMLAKKFLVKITADYDCPIRGPAVIGTHDYYDEETYEIWLETMNMEVTERQQVKTDNEYLQEIAENSAIIAESCSGGWF